MGKSNTRYHYTLGGVLVAGVSLLSNEILKMLGEAKPDKQTYLVVGASVLGGIILDKVFSDRSLDKLFRNCELENKDNHLPVVVKKTKKGDLSTYVLHLPPGLSQDDFEAKKQKLEQNLLGRIEFGFNKNLIMKVMHAELGTLYPYEFEECDKPLKVYCGVTHEGKFYLDIENCPHVLIGGETGWGKTTLLDTIILSFLQSKHNIDLHLIDFCAVGLGKYEDCRKVKSYGETVKDFNNLMNEMKNESDARLAMFRTVKSKVYVDKLSTWNRLYPNKALPYKIVIVDEFMRLANKGNEALFTKFRDRVSMDRKAGIHYIATATRPDVKIIEGSIKGNLGCRIAVHTVSAVDSTVILDVSGAEKIEKKGRFLAKYNGEIKEVHGLYIPAEKIRDYLVENNLIKSTEELKFEKEKNKPVKQIASKEITPEPIITTLNKNDKKQHQSQVEVTQAAYKKAMFEAFHKFVPNPYAKGNKK